VLSTGLLAEDGPAKRAVAVMSGEVELTLDFHGKKRTVKVETTV